MKKHIKLFEAFASSYYVVVQLDGDDVQSTQIFSSEQAAEAEYENIELDSYTYYKGLIRVGEGETLARSTATGGMFFDGADVIKEEHADQDEY